MDRESDVNRTVEAAYDVYAGSVRRYLTGITRDAEAAEDLTQDAFLRLTLEVGAGRVPDDVGAWLHRVGHNLAMSRARRRTVADRHVGELVRVDAAPSPEAAAIQAEAERAAIDAVRDLPIAHQQAVMLAAHGVDGPSIARTIGRSQGATRTLLCRARAQLRTTLLAAELG